MKTYLKKENGVTMIALIITIIIVIILAGVGISAVVPNGLIQRTEDISKNYSKQELIEQIYSEFDYKYYYIFGEELSDNKALVEEIYSLSTELNLPIDVFAINYAIDYENMDVDKTVKEIYYRYDKIVSVKKEDNYDYVFEDERTEEEVFGPNNEELEIINKLENEGIRKLKGDLNYDGILNHDDLTMYWKIYNEEYLMPSYGYYGFTNVQLKIGDLDGDEWLDPWSDGDWLLNEILLKLNEEE